MLKSVNPDPCIFGQLTKFYYLCIVNKNDGIGAQGNKNLLSGLAKFSACPERKKEVAKGDEVSKQQFSINLNFIFTTMTMKVKAIEKKMSRREDFLRFSCCNE